MNRLGDEGTCFGAGEKFRIEALRILTRAAPQLNIFAVGFPLTLAIGLLVLALALPYFTPVLERMIQDGLQIMPQISEHFRTNPR